MTEGVSHWLDVRDKPALLHRLMKELAGVAQMSLEGDLSSCRFTEDLVTARDETPVLKRNTIVPRQDFVVLRLSPETIGPIFEQVMTTGLNRAIIHVQIERDGVLELAACDNFHRDCVGAGPGVGSALLNELRGTHVLRDFKVAVRPQRSDFHQKPTCVRVDNMPKITPFLWFDNQAEEAVKFYTSIFKNSKIGTIARYGEAGPGPKGSVMTANFRLDGQEFVALNGGPVYKFSPAISFVVNCETQEEVDHYWDKLSAGGQKVQCGWLTDKYGVSWQIVPTILMKLLQDKDGEKVKRVMQAMMQMVKLDIKGLKQAYEQR